MTGEFGKSIDVKYKTNNGSKGDPDTYDPVLHSYHLTLWSKPLPDGSLFNLISNGKKAYRLLHKSEKGEFILSSDSIGHTYSRGNHGNIPGFIEEIPQNERQSFFDLCSTIGGYIVFPSNKIDNKQTMNMLRGTHAHIKDRFDLTLESLRRWYIGEANPLVECFDRYADFFNLFGDFKGYTDFFLLQDLVDSETGKVLFFLPFEEFGVTSPLPRDKNEYLEYRKNLSEFIIARNARIDRQ